MRKIIKRIISYFLIPVTRWYLAKERTHQYNGTTIKVLPGVFHPGLFASTNFLLQFLKRQDLENTTLLELGCGTGIISITAAKAGAIVTACDLSMKAIENVQLNAELASVDIDIIHSDLFNNIPQQPFDWIIINPPYYARKPLNEEQLAWHCGEDFEYFHKLFSALPDRLTNSTNCIMVLTKGCELDKIFSIAALHGLTYKVVLEKHVFFDGKNYLFSLEKAAVPDSAFATNHSKAIT